MLRSNTDTKESKYAKLCADKKDSEFKELGVSTTASTREKDRKNGEGPTRTVSATKMLASRHAVPHANATDSAWARVWSDTKLSGCPCMKTSIDRPR